MIGRRDLPAEIHALLLQDWRQARKAAKAFARACEDGDAVMLYRAVDSLNECVDAWGRAMPYVAKLPRVSPGSPERVPKGLDRKQDSSTFRGQSPCSPADAAPNTFFACGSHHLFFL